MIGITVPLKDRHFPYFACFDVECYFGTANLPKNGPQLTIESRDVALSFAISSNVPGLQSVVCRVTDSNEANLINKMVTCLSRDIETWLEIQPLILRTETLSIPENDLRVSVLYPMVFGNLTIYHFQHKQTTPDI